MKLMFVAVIWFKLYVVVVFIQLESRSFIVCIHILSGIQWACGIC